LTKPVGVAMKKRRGRVHERKPPMKELSGKVDQARAAFGQRGWAVARSFYASADADRQLHPADLEAWGLAALLTGHDDESDALRERAHYALLQAGDLDGAARVAFWLGLSLLLRGDAARGRGWFARPRSVLGDEAFAASVWLGYERVNAGMAALFSHDHGRSLDLLAEAREVADRHSDTDLRLLAGNGHGQALLALGRSAEGMAELDEVMVLATTGDAHPQAVGLVYCAVIAVCRSCLDIARSAEWTEVLSRWCESQPDLVPYRGQCLVHRSEVLQLQGRWDEATTEVEIVRERLDTYAHDVAVGMAHYQRGELHRLRGEFRAAEQAYREALAAGHDPQPGLALLRLVQGRAQAALLALRRALEENQRMFPRLRLLPAAVEVAIAARDLDTARSAAAELTDEAGRLDSAYLRAVAAAARGALALTDGESRSALAALRSALQEWTGLGAPYEAARCRVLVAQACLAVGDVETAQLETEAARRSFAGLGARVDLERLDAGKRDAAVPPDGLTPREIEVLRLVATGASNREVAEQLVLSERTVARHVANIFVKIGVSARAAATAYAYDHQLV